MSWHNLPDTDPYADLHLATQPEQFKKLINMPAVDVAAHLNHQQAGGVTRSYMLIHWGKKQVKAFQERFKKQNTPSEILKSFFPVHVHT